LALFHVKHYFYCHVDIHLIKCPCICFHTSASSNQLNLLISFFFFRYFDRLQQELEGYDCVLYEMVTSRDNLNHPKGPMAAKKMKSSRRGFSILGFIQKQMARILSLDYQLDCLDYGNEKWQHADLDYETFKQLQVTVLSSHVIIVLLLEMFAHQTSYKTIVAW
jgi:hypothetical protein